MFACVLLICCLGYFACYAFCSWRVASWVALVGVDRSVNLWFWIACLGLGVWTLVVWLCILFVYFGVVVFGLLCCCFAVAGFELAYLMIVV